MAETIVRFIGALIQAAFELFVQHTGKKALSLWGRKSNPFIELLIGLVVWSVAGLLLVAVIAALAAKPRRCRFLPSECLWLRPRCAAKSFFVPVCRVGKAKRAHHLESVFGDRWWARR